MWKPLVQHVNQMRHGVQVNQYLNDDFLGCMDPLPEFGLEDALPQPVELQVACPPSSHPQMCQTKCSMKIAACLTWLFHDHLSATRCNDTLLFQFVDWDTM